MLTSIRERAQGWFAWTIISLIIIVFVVWGIQNFFAPDPNLPVIQVDDTEVGLREFQLAYQQQRDQLRSVLDNSTTESNLIDERIKQQVINDLIERIVLNNNARDLGMRIGDSLLVAQIQAVNSFQVNGHFSKDRYEQMLRNQGMSPQAFEQRHRSALVGQQFYTGIVNTAFVTPKQLDRYLSLEGQNREIATLTVPASRFLAEVTVTTDEINDYYEKNKNAYQIPEQVTIAYLELKAEELAAHIETNDEELKALYEETRATYHKEERRHASHILITVDEKANEATLNNAKSKLVELKQQIIVGANFEELARAHSQDPGSAAQGGDLGFFSRGNMVKPFEDAVFSMKEGEISEVIKTQFGFHLIKLIAIDSEHDQDFSEVRPLVLKELRRTKAEKQFFELSEVLANLAYEHPDSLEPSATKLGLKIQTNGPVSRNSGNGIAANPKVLSAAFNEDVLMRGNNSDPIEISQNHLVVLRVTDHQAARHQSLAEVNETIVNKLRQQHAQAQATTLGENLLKDLRAGTDPQQIADKLQIAWQNLNFIGRQNSALSKELVETAFRLTKPMNNQPNYTGVANNGDFTIIKVSGIKDAELNTIAKQTRDETIKRLTNAAGEQNFTNIIKNFKNNSKVIVHKDRL